MLSVQGRRPLPTVPKPVALGVKGSTGAPWEVRRMTYVTTNAKLENPANWQKTGLTADRKVFVRELDHVR